MAFQACLSSLFSSIPRHARFGCGASCTRALPALSGGSPEAFVTTLPHWAKALSPPWEGQEERSQRLEGWRTGFSGLVHSGFSGLVHAGFSGLVHAGFSGLVHTLTHFAQHLPGTDWGTSRGPVRKSQHCPVRGPERKGNLESSLKEEPRWQEGAEENKGLWETGEPLCVSKGLWVSLHLSRSAQTS